MIVLWYDPRKELNQFFAVFLCMVLVWNIGSLLLQVSSITLNNPSLVGMAVGIMELGYTGSSIAIYSLTTVLIGVHTRRFRFLAIASLGIVVAYRFLLILVDADTVQFDGNRITAYQFQPLFPLFYLVFDGITLFLLWRFRRKFRSQGMVFGVLVFLAGQSLMFVNPDFAVASLTTTISSIGALIISFAVIQQEIMQPLAERNSQMEAMHKVTLSVSSQIAFSSVLNVIAEQAARWLNADAAGILLAEGDASSHTNVLRMAAVYELPQQYINTVIPVGQGVVGRTASLQQTLRVDNYSRDWREAEDFPLAHETFGSVVCVPLTYANNTIGILMVVSGKQSRVFDDQDVHMLEMLCDQAAVAVAHSYLFANQQDLTKQIEDARKQLEAVLSSTDNPVVAVDRKLRLIFANRAARSLFPIPTTEGQLTQHIPITVLPQNGYETLRAIRRTGGYIYEVTIDDRDFMCHLASLGENQGWVAVLNDVTQLKELDRMKSEMVRMASHDLKNPLMGAMAYVDLLRDELSEFDYYGSDETIKTLEWQLERMNRIIRGVLDVERVRSVQAKRDLCSPGNLVNDALDELSRFIANEDVEVEQYVQDDLPAFLGDYEQFRRVLVNLLENAVKFTTVNGKVCVKVYEENSQIIFEVSDNGVGIPESIQPHVFDRFYRGQQKAVAHVTGSGLGLSLVKTIVDNHQGRVWLDSQENAGSTFYVSVPVNSYIQVK